MDRVDDLDARGRAVYSWYLRLSDKYPTLGVPVGPHYDETGACNSTFPFEQRGEEEREAVVVQPTGLKCFFISVSQNK